MPGVVLIAGVSRFVGMRLAAQLAADPTVERVIGIDTVAPRADDLPLLGRTEFVRADIRNPLIAKVISQAQVTAVVHAALQPNPGAVGGRAPMQEMNVIGTMQLLAACQKSGTVERVVLRSTTAVYGSGPTAPAVLTEDGPGEESFAGGFAKDAVEVEGYVRGFARRRPDVRVSVLRLAQLIGPSVDNALTRYLHGPIVPTPAGYDPRLQLLHESDAVEVLRLATVTTRPGTSGVVNVAADDVVTLSQLVRLAGRVRLPVPPALFAVAGALARNPAAGDLAAEEAGFLRHGRVVCTARLRERFGYRPRYSTREAVDTYVRGRPATPRVGLAALGVGSDVLRARASRADAAPAAAEIGG